MSEHIPQNVADAYPRSRAPPRLLAIVTLLGCVIAYLVHRADFRPRARSSSHPTVAASTSSSNHLAICYSGDVGTHAHVYEQNLRVIRAVDPNATFFYYLDLVDDYAHQKTGARYSHVHSIGGLQPIFDQVRARAVSTFSRSQMHPPPDSHCMNRQGTDHEHYTRHYVQLYAAQKCYDMIKQAEAEGDKFDWILRLQPNMQIALKLPLDDVQPRVHMSGAAIALIPRSMADSFFSVVQAFDDDKCRVVDHMGPEPCKNYSYQSETVECLIIKWLRESDIIPSNGVYVNRRIIYPTDGQEEGH